MPLYDYQCSCGYREDNVFTGMNEYPNCPSCGSKLERVVGRFNVRQDSMEPYFNHTTQQWVESKAQHRRILKQHGKVEVGSESLESLRKHIRKPDPHARDDVKRDIAEVLKGYGH